MIKEIESHIHFGWDWLPFVRHHDHKDHHHGHHEDDRHPHHEGHCDGRHSRHDDHKDKKYHHDDDDHQHGHHHGHDDRTPHGGLWDWFMHKQHKKHHFNEETYFGNFMTKWHDFTHGFGNEFFEIEGLYNVKECMDAREVNHLSIKLGVMEIFLEKEWSNKA